MERTPGRRVKQERSEILASIQSFFGLDDQKH